MRSPSSRSSASIIRAVEVLPLVPVRWIDGIGPLRVAEQVEQIDDPVEVGDHPGREALLERLVDPGQRVDRRHRNSRARCVGRPPRLARCERPGEAEHRRARGQVVGGVGARRHVPLRPDKRARARSTRSTPRRSPPAARCTSGTSSPTRTPTWSPVIQRMRGREVFYPIGWDDNGLPSERRVQNFYGVRCDPSLPYDPDFAPPTDGGRRPRTRTPISRRNFVELCDAAHRRGREGVRGGLAAARRSRSTGRAPYRTIGATSTGDLAEGRSCATSPAATPTRPRRRRCGTSRSVRRSPRPSSRTASGRAPTTGSRSTRGRRRRPGLDRDHPARAAAGLRRPRRASRRRALPAAVRHHGAHAAVRRRGAGRRASARRSRQGLRHRDDLHVR